LPHGDVIVVDDRMQTGYSYILTEPMGRNFHPAFHPELTPKETLRSECSAANT
jgi:hypothetical protein